MIDHQYNKIVIECDSCGEVFNGEPGEEFAVLWARAKTDGWRTRKIGDEWVHGCHGCGV